MASKRWHELRPEYRKRLAAHGITEQQYNANDEFVRQRRQAARGHARTPEHGGSWETKAEAGFISAFVPDYLELDKQERQEVGRDFVLGFMTKGKSTDARKRARIRFQAWQAENGESWDKEQWAQYRSQYNAMLTYSA